MAQREHQSKGKIGRQDLAVCVDVEERLEESQTVCVTMML